MSVRELEGRSYDSAFFDEHERELEFVYWASAGLRCSRAWLLLAPCDLGIDLAKVVAYFAVVELHVWRRSAATLPLHHLCVFAILILDG